MQNTQGKTRRQHVMERVLGDVLRMRAEDRLIRASILDFRAKLENRCKVFPVYTIFRASILDFRAKLENQCKVFPVYTLFRASILDFRARLGNRCRGEWFRLLQPSLPPQRSASDSNLRSGNEE